MTTEDVMAVMNDPVAQELMHSDILARLAYTGRDGAPRVIPTGFLWDGKALIVCSPSIAPKVKALQADSRVALTIDTNAPPQKVLLVRGTARVEIVEGVPDEFLAASRKVIGDAQMPGFEESVRGLYKEMARITIAPEWAKIYDFVTRLPETVERLVREAEVAGRSGS